MELIIVFVIVFIVGVVGLGTGAYMIAVPEPISRPLAIIVGAVLGTTSWLICTWAAGALSQLGLFKRKGVRQQRNAETTPGRP